MNGFFVDYGRRRGKQLLPCVIIYVAFHLYFFFFLQEQSVGYLWYLDVLLLVPFFIWLAVDYRQFRNKRTRMQKLLDQEELICRILSDFENREIAEHDVQILEKQVGEQFQESCDLQDYVAKWCHELKLPLAAAFLMEEKIDEPKLKQALREQLEKMDRQLNSLLLGCKIQSPLFDLQIIKASLFDCVRTSIRNNRFFLIQHGFSLDVKAEPLSVHTDPSWLIYVLDQLLSNAIKYKREDAKGPRLVIWSEKQGAAITLLIEDNGEGICKEDIRRIFEKGFTGKNYHNGHYRSTGMGLYMAETMIRRMGHEIRVESEYGAYTRFCIVFHENPYYFGNGQAQTFRL